MEVKEYLNQKAEQHQNLLEFIESENDFDENFQEYITNLQIDDFSENKEEILNYLHLIVKVCNNHHRYPNFLPKIEKILLYIFSEIKQTLSNLEIFKIFKSNKLLLMCLIKNHIIVIDEDAASFILHNSDIKYEKYHTYRSFFFTEISQFFDKKRKAKIENSLIEKDENILVDFDQKRQIGENHLYVCSLIRNDSIDDFIVYINKNSISLTSKVSSLFETNPFLVDKEPSFIEYSAFFGSIQIFNFLRLNRVKLEPSLWLFAIHGRNADIIHLLEENNVMPEDKTYNQCFEESIKCHHNDFAIYFKDNFLMHNFDYTKFVELCFVYQNFSLLLQNNENENNLTYIFTNACKFNYNHLVQLFVDDYDQLDLDQTIFSNQIRAAFDKDKSELADILLSKKDLKLTRECFENCLKITKISIPSNVIFIGDRTFSGCQFLTEINLPLSINSIEPFTFTECSALKKITIPASIIEIKNSAFCGCVNLVDVQILSPLKLIGDCAFSRCFSLTEISIPSSVTSIGSFAFTSCVSLKKFVVPSSIQNFGKHIFSNCPTLTQITVPFNFDTKSLGDKSNLKIIYE